MVKLNIGKRSVGSKAPRPTKTITPEALQDFKDTGRKVREKDGFVFLDGFRKFKVVGAGAGKFLGKEAKFQGKRFAESAVEGAGRAEVSQDFGQRNELIDFNGGVEAETDFGIRVSGRKNELTEFV